MQKVHTLAQRRTVIAQGAWTGSALFARCTYVDMQIKITIVKFSFNMRE